MKKIILLMIVSMFSYCTVQGANKPKPCGKYEGHNIYKGDKGGCYYLKTKKKVKVYIDKKHCKC